MESEIQGNCDARFSKVKAVFREHFKKGQELGAALAVTIDNKPVVDIWGGYMDAEETKPWQRDTLVHVYSSTKGMTATCMHRLVDQGLLEIERPVSHYWPEFAQKGKENIQVGHLLSHRSGLPAIRAPLNPEDAFDWKTMVQALEREEPWWPPGTKHGYHARTFGWLLGELIWRVTGKSPGTYFRDEIAKPLGLDFHIGLRDEHFHRIASLLPMTSPKSGATPKLNRIIISEPESISSKAFLNPPIFRIPDVINSPEWRRIEVPSSNGHGTARAIARLYGALACGGSVDGYRVLTPERIEKAREEQSSGIDEVLLTETRFGLGYMLPAPEIRMGTNDRAFGAPGMGGSIGFADPEARLGFGYVMNKSGSNVLLDPRPAALIDALYEAMS
jgi:CubicO group peptidase (beta-lactamase class C family)